MASSATSRRRSEERSDARTDVTAPLSLPPGDEMELPGRGTTFVRHAPGPPGAPTVILLHGLTATADLNWFTSYATLARHFRVVALDHRGHGRGIRSRRQFRLADCADDVVAVADRLGIHRFVPVGYSMGGPIAQLTWHRHRSRVAGLVLCATSRNFRGRPGERILFGTLAGVVPAARLTTGNMRRRVTERVMAGRVPIDDALALWVRDEFSRSDPAKVMEAAAALGSFSSHAWIGQIDVPTAVVITERDRLVPPHRQHKLADVIPGAVVVPVQGDHGVCVDDPQLFVAALMRACRIATST